MAVEAEHRVKPGNLPLDLEDLAEPEQQLILQDHVSLTQEAGVAAITGQDHLMVDPDQEVAEMVEIVVALNQVLIIKVAAVEEQIILMFVPAVSV